MLFEIKFEVVEIYKSGVTTKHYLKGNKKDVEKDIEEFKNKAKDYQMVGKNGMVVFR